MQARVLEAERDVLLGGQVLFSTSSAPLGRANKVATPRALPATPNESARTAPDCSSVAQNVSALRAYPKPPFASPVHDDTVLFSRPNVLHAGIGALSSNQQFPPSSGSTRRARSFSHRLNPLE